MIHIKKIIYFVTASSFTLVVLAILVLFLYATFFFTPPLTKKNITLPSHIQVKQTPSKKVKISKKIGVPKIKKAIKNSLFASVGNKAVTQWDITNEMKMVLILSGQSFSEEIKEQLQTAAIHSAIKRNVKKIEIEKYPHLTFNQADLDQELNRWARNLNLDLNKFEDVFVSNGMSFSTVIDQLKTELIWNSLIFELYKDRLTINLEEIDEQLRIFQNKNEVEEYLISEIIIKPVPKNKLESTIKEIKNKIKIDGFKKVAMNLSISKTALEGGNLGWINENAISKKFKSKITNTPVGNISEPIFLPEGILFFKVRDKKKIKKFISLEDAKNQIVNAEKTKMLNMYSRSYYEKLKKSISINYY